MGYAEVSVNSPISRRSTFSYAVPPNLNLVPGHAVCVPFGEKILQGIVVGLTEQPAVEETREIIDLIKPQPVLTQAQVSLARWISDYYLSPLFDALALMLPPGFERKPLTFVQHTSEVNTYEIATLPEEQQKARRLVEDRKTALSEVEKSLGKEKARRALAQLVQKGLLQRSYDLEPVKIKPRVETFISLKVDAAQALEETQKLSHRAPQQLALLQFLIERKKPVSLSEARRQTGCGKNITDALAEKGLVEIQQKEVRREPTSLQNVALSMALDLTPAQQSAFEAIKSSLGNGSKKPFLLYGVTASGKTEIYLQALAEAVRLGKKGIVLVPEIALTPQTIERFASRFPDRVAVLHSQLSPGEQFDEWHRIKKGEVDVVIGPRSALFAPQPNLGLIVLDEEHEWTYKQQDKSPRYHARRVALKLAELTGAALVLGSATPDVETFYHTQQGDYALLELPERVAPNAGSPLPRVRIVDMREELKAGNTSLFSRALSEELTRTLYSYEQAILFLNRRGASTFIQCRSCGFTLRCRRCEVPLTYHSAEDVLVCHQCNYKVPVSNACPRCRNRRLKFLGGGTQKLEQETGMAFPRARLLRWDSDAAQGKEAHQKILHQFREHKADVLIGTQMVAKGLDLPMITLVGVVNADTALNLPDFRAGERTFQILSQVAGRAGRGLEKGQVIIQTYSPEHYAIRAAAEQDYRLFYQQEIDYRRQLHNPPFSQLARLLFSHTNDARCQQETTRMKNLLNAEIKEKGIENISLIGPAPAFIHRLRGKSRWQIVVRGTKLNQFLATIDFPKGWTVDIDPVGLA